MLKKKEILKFINQISKCKNMKYPLSPNSFSDDDIYQAAKVLFSKNITMGEITKKFEKSFAKFIGAKYALILGEEEENEKKVKVKDLNSSGEVTVSQNQLIHQLEKLDEEGGIPS